MKLKDSIKAILQKHNVKLSVVEDEDEVKMMAQGTTPDGVIIATPADRFGEGVEVFIVDAEGNTTPAPDGDHTLIIADGDDAGTYTITVAEGKITAIVTADDSTDDVEAAEAVIEELAATNAALSAQVAALTEERDTLSTQLSAVTKERDNARAEMVKLSKKDAAKSVTKKAKEEAEKEAKKPVRLSSAVSPTIAKVAANFHKN